MEHPKTGTGVETWYQADGGGGGYFDGVFELPRKGTAIVECLEVEAVHVKWVGVRSEVLHELVCLRRGEGEEST